MTKATVEQIDAALADVNRLIADGSTMVTACDVAARAHNIPASKKKTPGEFLQRQWASRQAGPAPSRVRAGRPRRSFI